MSGNGGGELGAARQRAHCVESSLCLRCAVRTFSILLFVVAAIAVLIVSQSLLPARRTAGASLRPLQASRGSTQRRVHACAVGG